MRTTTKARSTRRPRPQRAWRELDWYETPRWYDIVFDVDTRREADFLEAMLARHGPKPRARTARHVLEPAAGSGRLVAELARRGYSVAGFDRSAAMLAFARARLARAGLSARLRRADMADFDLGRRFVLAHCLVSTFKYLLDEKSARSHLECVARSLVPGGLYVLGFHLSDYSRSGCSRERWVETKYGATVVCNTQLGPANRATRLEDVRTRLVVRKKGGEFRSETRWQFRSYDSAQARKLFASVPALEMIDAYDFNYDLDSPREVDDKSSDLVLVLRKRS
jgi:SAM-dependent methyltransferase